MDFVVDSQSVWNEMKSTRNSSYKWREQREREREREEGKKEVNDNTYKLYVLLWAINTIAFDID